MRFLLDENESPAVLPPLRIVLFDHEFVSAEEAGLRGVDDPVLFELAAQQGFDAIITKDHQQLHKLAEVRSLLDNDLHWIGHHEPAATGVRMIAAVSAAYLVALPHIVEELASVTEPTAFIVKGIPGERAQRYTPKPIKSMLR